MGRRHSRHQHVVTVHRTVGPSDAQIAQMRQAEAAAQQARVAAEAAALAAFNTAVANLHNANQQAIEALRIRFHQEMEAEVERKVCEQMKIKEDERKAAVEAFFKHIEGEQEAVRQSLADAALYFRTNNLMISPTDLHVDWKANPLGEGGFAKVYFGQLKRSAASASGGAAAPAPIPVAIKRYFAGAPDCPKAINSLKDEVKALSSLSHKNIAQMMGVCQLTEGAGGSAVAHTLSLCLVLEYVNGSDLYSLLHCDGKRWGPKATIEIGLQIAEALAYMYSQNIACRDVKTSNILIVGSHFVKIVDFGLAAHFGVHAKADASKTSTSNKKMDRISKKTIGKTQVFVAAKECGTLAYSAPELAFGTAKHTLKDLEKCDVYSFAITLNEVIGGDVPYIDSKTGEPECENDMQLKLLIGQNYRPAEAPNASEPLLKLIRQCWQPNPSQRPTFAQIVTALQTIRTQTTGAAASMTLSADQLQTRYTTRSTLRNSLAAKSVVQPTLKYMSSEDRLLAKAMAESQKSNSGDYKSSSKQSTHSKPMEKSTGSGSGSGGAAAVSKLSVATPTKPSVCPHCRESFSALQTLYPGVSLSQHTEKSHALTSTTKSNKLKMGGKSSKETVIREIVRDNSGSEAEFKRRIEDIKNQMSTDRVRYEQDLKGLESKGAAEREQLKEKLTTEFQNKVESTVCEKINRKENEKKEILKVYFDKQKQKQNEAYEAALALQKEFGDKAIAFSELQFDRETDKIGEGAFGKVYRGTLRGVRVAIKEFNQLLDTSESVRSISEEFKVLRSMNHPLIVAFIGISLRATVSSPQTVSNAAPGPVVEGSFSATKPQLYLVMEFVEGMDLATYLHETKDEPLSYVDACNITAQLATAMEYVHQMGIVHRDLKAENVMLCIGFGIKLMDFGLAVRRRKASTSSAKSSNNPNRSSVVSLGGLSTLKSRALGPGVAGTPLYMPPEATTGYPHDMTRADVFSFGILGWQIYNRKVPYAEAKFESDAILAKFVAEGVRPAWPSGLFPNEVVELLTDCVCGDPTLRPDFAELAREFKAIHDRAKAVESQLSQSFSDSKQFNAAILSATTATGALKKSAASTVSKSQSLSVSIRPVMSGAGPIIGASTSVTKLTPGVMTTSQAKRFASKNGGAPSALPTGGGGSAGDPAIDAKYLQRVSKASTLTRISSASASPLALQRKADYKKLTPFAPIAESKMIEPNTHTSSKSTSNAKTSAVAVAGTSFSHHSKPVSASALGSSSAALTTDGLVVSKKTSGSSVSSLTTSSVKGPKICPNCHKSAGALAEADDTVSFSAHLKACKQTNAA